MAERNEGLPAMKSAESARDDLCREGGKVPRVSGAQAASGASSGRRYTAMPGAFIAAAGFACMLLAMEGFRLSSVFYVGDALSPTFPFESLIALALLLVVALVWRRSARTARIPLVFVVAVAVVYTAFLLMDLGQSVVVGGAPSFSALSTIALDVLPILLMFFWAVELFAFGAAAVFYVGGLSLLGLAFLNYLTAFLKPDAALVVVSLMPVISAALLAYFREYGRFRCVYPTAANAAVANSGHPTEEGVPFANQITGVAYPDRSMIVPPDWERGGRLFFLITLMISMACFAVVFGQVHSLWVLLQDCGPMSLIVQMGAASGTAVAGVLALLFVRFLWNRRCIEVLKLLLLGTVLVALWLSSFSEGPWVFSYLVFLNVTQKLVLLLIMLSPFLVVERRAYLWPWWLTCLAFELGKALSQLLIGAPNDNLFVVGTAVPVAILFVCTLATAFLGDAAHGARIEIDGTAPADAPDAVGCQGCALAADARIAEEGEQGNSRANRLRTACTKVAGEFGLTSRETEILLLLARGRTAATIAETLVITPSTAKTHLRNIYAKLGVHTQQELIDLVESYID